MQRRFKGNRYSESAPILIGIVFIKIPDIPTALETRPEVGFLKATAEQ